MSLGMQARSRASVTLSFLLNYGLFILLRMAQWISRVTYEKRLLKTKIALRLRFLTNTYTLHRYNRLFELLVILIFAELLIVCV